MTEFVKQFPTKGLAKMLHEFCHGASATDPHWPERPTRLADPSAGFIPEALPCLHPLTASDLIATLHLAAPLLP